jgi:hypothetical protein
MEQNKIVDLGRHSQQTIEGLRELLAAGATVRPDARRPGFFDVDSGSDTYFIHVSPVTGNILLLAAWKNHPSGDALFRNGYDAAPGAQVTIRELRP